MYKVKINPFHSEIFISCSADWTVRIWNSKFESPVYVLKSIDLNDEVLDVRWNPKCSTSFATACKDGRIEMWDIGIKNLDPIFTLPADGKTKTTLEFSEQSPILAFGNEFGELQMH